MNVHQQTMVVVWINASTCLEVSDVHVRENSYWPKMDEVASVRFVIITESK